MFGREPDWQLPGHVIAESLSHELEYLGENCEDITMGLDNGLRLLAGLDNHTEMSVVMENDPAKSGCNRHTTIHANN